MNIEANTVVQNRSFSLMLSVVGLGFGLVLILVGIFDVLYLDILVFINTNILSV